jgi:hypothetical protein
MLRKQLTKQQLAICYPGVLQSLGNGYLANDTLLKQIIDENRKQGFTGEVFFYFDGIKKKQDWFATNYKEFKVAPKPFGIKTTIDAKKIQLIKDGIKDFGNNITVAFGNNKAIFTGTTTNATKLKLHQMCASVKVIADMSGLKIVQ